MWTRIFLLYPQAAEKTFLLREFDDTLDIFEKDISDPIGGSYEVYLNCRDQIEQGIASLMRFIDQGEAAARLHRRPTSPAVTIALGADHGGYELKEILKEYLTKPGRQSGGFGDPFAPLRRIIRIMPQPWRRACLRTRRNWACSICTTGVGMCMTANHDSGHPRRAGV